MYLPENFAFSLLHRHTLHHLEVTCRSIGGSKLSTDPARMTLIAP
jgi:hypothetical protein